ncbi:MAG: methylisocitrate lyase [Gemmatimonadetes bacterium]|jgi:methylisocitrate lyase|nr:methylisocitrate lyase [Gemmatimonadota bacterium]MBT6149729.1 methylisocitrate lyase [Gemmatimonadota bacterium]MBT7863809.1 methylisocitrate lyase [Gemmatimonadota bacterium]
MNLTPGVTAADKAARLRQAIGEGTVTMPGCFNAPVAMMAQQLGFEAIYISGAGIINGVSGYPDIALMGVEEVARIAGYIAQAVDVPALCDADTGFGEALQVMRTIQCFERAGVAGVHLEDQVMPKRCGHLDGKRLVPSQDMETKLKAAATARSNPDFLLVARTDARAVEGFDAAVERGLRYLDAGADVIFIEALQTEEEFGRYAELVQAPLLANMTEFGKTPLLSVDQFRELGYRMVIFPMTAFRVMMKAVEGVLTDLRDTGSATGWIDRMQTRTELYELLDYESYHELDRHLATDQDVGDQKPQDAT